MYKSVPKNKMHLGSKICQKTFTKTNYLNRQLDLLFSISNILNNTKFETCLSNVHGNFSKHAITN